MIEAPDPNDDKTRGIIEEYSREFLEHYVANFTDTTKVKMGKRQMDRNHRMYEYLFEQTSIKRDMIQESGFFNAPEINAMKKDTLLLYGSASNCLEAGKRLNKKISRSNLIPLDGDHNIPIQEPVMIAELVSGFFKN